MPLPLAALGAVAGLAPRRLILLAVIGAVLVGAVVYHRLRVGGLERALAAARLEAAEAVRDRAALAAGVATQNAAVTALAGRCRAARAEADTAAVRALTAPSAGPAPVSPEELNLWLAAPR
jgi:hypothetical protein